MQTRTLTIIAQDPKLCGADGEMLLAQVEVPLESLSPGPMGHRIHVIDYNASTGKLYRARSSPLEAGRDPFESSGASSEALLRDPTFHQQHVFAVAMATLARFEASLGRRVRWAFPMGGHQLKIAPHAFADANAFYSRDDEALLFGYFRGNSGENVFTCLSHDVVAHETTHALLDGLRGRYMYPSSPDQAAFHEGFADTVALLSVFSIPAVLDVALRVKKSLVPTGQLEAGALRGSALLGLAEQLGEEMNPVRSGALRQSAELDPADVDLESAEYREPHRRGEVFVAAMMNAFLAVWLRRLKPLSTHGGRGMDRDRVVEEGARAAERLLSASIRAIDYSPPVDLLFGDYLSALLTADREINPDDEYYDYRGALRTAFAEYGITPTSLKSPFGPGYWNPAPSGLSYRGVHFESLKSERDEVFRFVWENRKALEIHEDAYTQVQSVRPCRRIDPDGFFLHETVAEYVQIIRLRARELGQVKLRPPPGMHDDQLVPLYGGGALIFDEFGRLRYHVHNSVKSRRQQKRLDYLYGEGATDAPNRGNLAEFHRKRSILVQSDPHEEW